MTRDRLKVFDVRQRDAALKRGFDDGPRNLMRVAPRRRKAGCRLPVQFFERCAEVFHGMPVGGLERTLRRHHRDQRRDAVDDRLEVDFARAPGGFDARAILIPHAGALLAVAIERGCAFPSATANHTFVSVREIAGSEGGEIARVLRGNRASEPG